MRFTLLTNERDIQLIFLRNKYPHWICNAHVPVLYYILYRLSWQDGKIIEDGTHNELIENGSEYAGLWERQTGAFNE